MGRRSQTGHLQVLSGGPGAGLRAAAALVAAAAPLVAACGPKQIEIDPRSVVDLQVRPASGQRLFCPGDRFQVEVVAKLKDGTTCSSTDPSRGCLGQKDAVISAADVRITGSAGVRGQPAEQFVWIPPSNPLETADTGLTLKGWLERTVEGQPVRSMEGESELRPVYQCQTGGAYSYGPPGAPGPNVDIAVTTLSTPYYPAAALVRVDVLGSRYYFISPSADRAISVVTSGQAGMPGAYGEAGKNGKNGKSAPAGSPACTRGGPGGDGTDGGPGGDGGDGGDGGRIRILLDEAAADRLQGRVLAQSLGGAPGPAGPGGQGGFAGDGGSGGPTSDECTDTSGPDGKPGRDGPPGRAGRAGLPGPPPEVSTAPRASLFAAEMAILTRIEAAKAKPAQ